MSWIVNFEFVRGENYTEYFLIKFEESSTCCEAEIIIYPIHWVLFLFYVV